MRGQRTAPARKRRRVTENIEELKFDPAARQEYLTGFHKRKLQRIKHAQEQAAKTEKEEKVQARKEVRHLSIRYEMQGSPGLTVCTDETATERGS